MMSYLRFCARSLFRGLLFDLGWLMGLMIPFGRNFDPKRWITSQRLEQLVEQHIRILGLPWRLVDGNWKGIKLVSGELWGFWLQWIQFLRIRRTINKATGLRLRSPEAVCAFLRFVAELESAKKLEKETLNA
jgi:hypothetical protein